MKIVDSIVALHRVRISVTGQLPLNLSGGAPPGDARHRGRGGSSARTAVVILELDKSDPLRLHAVQCGPTWRTSVAASHDVDSGQFTTDGLWSITELPIGDCRDQGGISVR